MAPNDLFLMLLNMESQSLLLKKLSLVSHNQLTTPTKYGLPASPNACEIKIWNASAVDRRVGTTTYCGVDETQQRNG